MSAEVGGRVDYTPSVSCVTNREGRFRVFFGTRLVIFGTGARGERAAGRGVGVRVQTRTNLLGLACHRGAGPRGICGEKGAEGGNT